VGAAAEAGDTRRCCRVGRHKGAVAEAGGTWALSQKRAALGRRRRSERLVGAAAEVGNTRRRFFLSTHGLHTQEIPIRRSGRHVGSVAEAGVTWAPSQKRAAQGRRHRSGRHVGAAAKAGGTRRRRRVGLHKGAVAEADGTWAPLQERAARGRRHRSGRQAGAVAEAGGTRVPPQKRAADGRRCRSGQPATPVLPLSMHGLHTQETPIPSPRHRTECSLHQGGVDEGLS
jgi:hypothetical protein